ncbi:DUF1985 domain-containing protein [Abeliophyllum distichum]|uniref:DUF1985 domain-containing protein n=1 Tax=Abeliophyllum distichum TaxID=126358 RepID=A0ABD1TJQ4_9LAMI
MIAFQQSVENVFKEFPSDTIDKDMVDVGIIYLISSFLFITSYHKCVDDSIFGLDESGEMESFPWGKELYNLILMSLKGAFSKRIMKLDTSKKKLEYRLNGFLLAFQVWIYETIPTIAAKKLCVKYKQSLPRILSWSSNVHLTSLQLNKRIFDLIKNDAKNVANDTMDLKKNLTDCPSFSLGIEFDMTGKSIEESAETNVEKSIDQDIINFNGEDWKIVDDVATHSLAKKMHQNTVCASSSKTCEIDVNDDDVELKDEDWQKIDEIAAAVLAKHKLEEAIVLFDYFSFE